MWHGFRWNDWNVDHLSVHGVSPQEAERVVTQARPPYPRRLGQQKWLVEGRGHGGRFLRVIFAVGADDVVYVITAMPLTTRGTKGR